MKKVRKAHTPLWKRPSRVAWLICALIFSAYLMVHMPEKGKSVPSGMGKSSVQAAQMEPIEPVEPVEQYKPRPPQASIQQPTAPMASQPHLTAPKASADTKPYAEKTWVEKFFTKLQSFTRLFLVVGIAAFLGGIIEFRCWHLVLGKIMGRLTQVARLPEIVGLAMPTALVSSLAANTMLVTSHAEGQIRTSALIAGGMANSYLAYVSHSLRVCIPVIMAIGLPGVCYFAVQFSGGLLVILAVFAWNRWHIDHHTSAHRHQMAEPCSFTPSSWKETFKKAFLRSCTLLFRITCITVPLMLSIEWLLKIGAFDFWNEYVPASIHMFFPVEAISIVATQIGGLIQSSAVAANLREEGLITNAQILLAMLAASAVGNPIRTLRRNLPTALAIFPANIAFIVVFSMQFSRLLITILGVGATAFYIHSVQ